MSWEIIVGFATGVLKTLSRVLDMIKTKANINTGRVIEQAEQAKEETEVNRQQTEILMEERTKEDTIKKMENGTF